MDLLNNNLQEINHMAQFGEYVRIGHIWYGKDRQTTVPNIYYFADKNVTTVQGLRAEAAMSFSSSRPAVDSVQIELVVNYSRFESHVQQLVALIQVSPVLPILNPLVAALTMPMYHNKMAYTAYGVPSEVIEGEFDAVPGRREQVIKAYAQVPTMCKVDMLNMETLAPRELRMVLRLTRVLTMNSYGDQTMYVKTHEDAQRQDLFIRDLMNYKRDDVQVEAMGAMLGMNTYKIRDMITKMQAMRSGSPFLARTRARITNVLEGDMFTFVELKDDGSESSPKTGFLYGVECPIGQIHLKEYEVLTYDEPLKGKIVPQVPYTYHAIKSLQAILAKSVEPGKIVYVEAQAEETWRAKVTPARAYSIKVPVDAGGKTLLDVGEEMIKAGAAWMNEDLSSTDPLYRTYQMAAETATKNMVGSQYGRTSTEMLLDSVDQGQAYRIYFWDKELASTSYNISQILNRLMAKTLTIQALPPHLYRLILNTCGSVPNDNLQAN